MNSGLALQPGTLFQNIYMKLLPFVMDKGNVPLISSLNATWPEVSAFLPRFQAPTRCPRDKKWRNMRLQSVKPNFHYDHRKDLILHCSLYFRPNHSISQRSSRKPHCSPWSFQYWRGSPHNWVEANDQYWRHVQIRFSLCLCWDARYGTNSDHLRCQFQSFRIRIDSVGNIFESTKCNGEIHIGSSKVLFWDTNNPVNVLLNVVFVEHRYIPVLSWWMYLDDGTLMRFGQYWDEPNPNCTR